MRVLIFGVGLRYLWGLILPYKYTVTVLRECYYQALGPYIVSGLAVSLSPPNSLSLSLSVFLSLSLCHSSSLYLYTLQGEQLPSATLGRVLDPRGSSLTTDLDYAHDALGLRVRSLEIWDHCIQCEQQVRRNSQEYLDLNRFG